ncbi:hypothetical protein KFE25_012769 [Diacronema lutheri]|uniref:CS domain-containing protein n=2 Tax=Diacronema lutheri TaxID=2081491 RepID=A0A8J6C245_DIALT|nr:hypothetical protein KFE25_012769 [Diacronema lutheri]
MPVPVHFGGPGGLLPPIPKDGAFTGWTEDEESCELKLPLPPGTKKADINASITPTSLSVALRAGGAPLLIVSPLAARIVSDETTWFLEDGVMVITLAKMQGVGATSAAQIWGRSLCAGGPGSTFECYLSPAEVAARLGIEPPPQRAPVSDGTGWAALAAACAAAVVAVATAVLLLSGR